jgi:hypothetical protein
MAINLFLVGGVAQVVKSKALSSNPSAPPKKKKLNLFFYPICTLFAISVHQEKELISPLLESGPFCDPH